MHTVLIDGRVVLDARRPTRLDAELIFRSVQSSVARIFDRMGYQFKPKWAQLTVSYIRLCVKVDLRAAEPSNGRDAPAVVKVTANHVLRRMLPPDVNGRLL